MNEFHISASDNVMLKCSLFILMAMDLTPFTMATSVSLQRFIHYA